MRFENVCPKSGVSPPLQIWDSKPPFRRFRNLTTTLTAYRPIFGMKHNIVYIIGQMRCKLQGVSYIVSQNVIDFGPQTAQNWTVILPTFRKFCILLPFRLRGRRSANETEPYCQTLYSKSRLQTAAKSVSSSQELKGQQNFWSFFRRLPDNSECLRNETRHRQSGKGVGKYKGSLTLSHKLVNLVHKWLIIVLEFLFTLCKFCVLLLNYYY